MTVVAPGTGTAGTSGTSGGATADNILTGGPSLSDILTFTGASVTSVLKQVGNLAAANITDRVFSLAAAAPDIAKGAVDVAVGKDRAALGHVVGGYLSYQGAELFAGALESVVEGVAVVTVAPEVIVGAIAVGAAAAIANHAVNSDGSCPTGTASYNGGYTVYHYNCSSTSVVTDYGRTTTNIKRVTAPCEDVFWTFFYQGMAGAYHGVVDPPQE
ncbi:MAG: hypothetical protein ACYDCF_09010, partial [Burkholderiales bacterium]